MIQHAQKIEEFAVIGTNKLDQFRIYLFTRRTILYRTKDMSLYALKPKLNNQK